MYGRIIIGIICLIILTSCCTRGGLYRNGNGADRVREHLDELTNQQTESALTSERLNNSIESSAQESGELARELAQVNNDGAALERSITDGTRDLESLAAILQQIRARGSTTHSGASSGD